MDSALVKNGVVELKYTTASTKSGTVAFANPLIVSIPKGQYKAVRFVEDGRVVKTLGIGKRDDAAAAANTP